MVIVMVTLWAILAVQLIHPINYRTPVVVRVRALLPFLRPHVWPCTQDLG